MLSITEANFIIIPISVLGILYAILNSYILSRIKVKNSEYQEVNEQGKICSNKEIQMIVDIGKYISSV